MQTPLLSEVFYLSVSSLFKFHKVSSTFSTARSMILVPRKQDGKIPLIAVYFQDCFHFSSCENMYD